MNQANQNNQRRGFLRWLSGTGLAAALVTAGCSKAGDAQPKPKPPLYTGTSDTGDLKQALDKAIKAVPVPCCDRVVQWEMVSLSGESGGIDGRHKLTVTITAHVE